MQERSLACPPLRAEALSGDGTSLPRGGQSAVGMEEAPEGHEARRRWHAARYRCPKPYGHAPPGSALQPAHAAAAARLHGPGGAHARAGHRREHGHVQRGGWRAAAPPAPPRARAAGGLVGRPPGDGPADALPAQLQRLSRGRLVLGVPVGFRDGRPEPHGPGRAGAAQGRARHGQLLPGGGHLANPRAHLRDREGSAGRSSRRRGEPGLLDTAPRRGSGGAGEDAHARCCASRFGRGWRRARGHWAGAGRGVGRFTAAGELDLRRQRDRIPCPS